MKTLIIGMGEVGEALRKVLGDYVPQFLDKKFTLREVHGVFDIIHICFPYSKNFVEQVKSYQKKYKPKYTVIHSTVPVGTSTLVGAVHSPIRGIHPHLESGIRTFPKCLGGRHASGVADYFRRAGLRVVLFDKSETTEAMKLFDTQYYLECIRFAHRVKKYCDKHGLNFHEVYTIPNQDYNAGYSALGHPEFVRPVLQPIMTPVGGHCLMPNEVLLAKSEKK